MDHFLAFVQLGTVKKNITSELTLTELMQILDKFSHFLLGIIERLVGNDRLYFWLRLDFILWLVYF